MFNAEDFEISLEEELKLRIIEDEIKNCYNVEELQKQLITVTRLFQSYQQLLSKIAVRVIQADMDKMDNEESMKAFLLEITNG